MLHLRGIARLRDSAALHVHRPRRALRLVQRVAVGAVVVEFLAVGRFRTVRQVVDGIFRYHLQIRSDTFNLNLLKQNRWRAVDDYLRGRQLRCVCLVVWFRGDASGSRSDGFALFY